MSLKSLFQRVMHGKRGNMFEFHVLNAFTDRYENTLGNPASICIVDSFPSDTAMGDMAKRLGTAMTTFLRRTDRKDVYEVRHFSPDGNENHICGHALVAATEHLARTYPEFRAGRDVTYLVNPKYRLNATNSMKAHIAENKISLSLPAVFELQEVRATDFYRDLSNSLNIPEDRILRPAYFAPRANNYLVIVETADDIVSLKPDFGKLNALSHAKEFLPQASGDSGEDKIVPFWVLTARAAGGNFDILNRVFSPDIGVDEDPACGSANCSAIPYWGLIDRDFSAAGKKDFKVLYPYPPGGEGCVGGVQRIRLNMAWKEIILTSEATFKKIVTLQPPAEDNVLHRKKGPAPR